MEELDANQSSKDQTNGSVLSNMSSRHSGGSCDPDSSSRCSGEDLSLQIVTDFDYAAKRKRNNDAVKKSRQKARKRLNDTMATIRSYERDNEKLEKSIFEVSKEITFLKVLFKNHLKTHHPELHLADQATVDFMIVPCIERIDGVPNGSADPDAQNNQETGLQEQPMLY